MSTKNVVNRTRILREIWRTPGISRVEIASNLNLNKSTITKILNKLIEIKIVRDKNSTISDSTLGRNRVGLEINRDFGIALGIEIETDFYRIIMIDLYGEIIQKVSNRIEDSSIYDIIDMAVNKAITLPGEKKILGIGIGLSGTVDSYNRVILKSNPLNIYTPVDLNNYFNKFDFPIFIENDANCCSYGELTFNRESNDKDFLTVLGESRSIEISNKHKGLAIGLGMVFNNRVHHGRDYTSGEFRSILRKSGTRSQFSVEGTTLEGDLLDEFLKHLSLLINTFNFTKIVFSGVITTQRDIISEKLPLYMLDNWLYSEINPIEIIFSQFNEYSVSYGAAGIVVSKLFTPPENQGSADSIASGINLFKGI